LSINVILEHLKFHYKTQLHALSHNKRDSYGYGNSALQQLTNFRNSVNGIYAIVYIEM